METENKNLTWKLSLVIQLLRSNKFLLILRFFAQRIPSFLISLRLKRLQIRMFLLKLRMCLCKVRKFCVIQGRYTPDDFNLFNKLGLVCACINHPVEVIKMFVDCWHNLK
jgi:hypothetical protein